jgi:hypothetical protein
MSAPVINCPYSKIGFDPPASYSHWDARSTETRAFVDDSTCDIAASQLAGQHLDRAQSFSISMLLQLALPFLLFLCMPLACLRRH